MASVEEPSASPTRLKFALPVKVRDAGVAVGGMALGALIGTGVQQALQSTGILGPGVDSLIAEQQANFTEVNVKLDSLRQFSTDPAARRALAELSALLQKQSALATQTEQQLRLMANEAASSKERELAESGMSGGADFWLKIGESLNLGARDQVFALQGYGNGVVQISLSGAVKRMAVGDVVEFTAGERACKVFYKQATPRQDGRVGFDLDCD